MVHAISNVTVPEQFSTSVRPYCPVVFNPPGNEGFTPYVYILCLGVDWMHVRGCVCTHALACVFMPACVLALASV